MKENQVGKNMYAKDITKLPLSPATEREHWVAAVHSCFSLIHSFSESNGFFLFFFKFLP